MALFFTLPRIAAAPESGVMAQARATARIVAAEEIDFSQFGGSPLQTTIAFRRFDGLETDDGTNRPVRRSVSPYRIPQARALVEEHRHAFDAEQLRAIGIAIVKIGDIDRFLLFEQGGDRHMAVIAIRQRYHPPRFGVAQQLDR